MTAYLFSVFLTLIFLDQLDILSDFSLKFEESSSYISNWGPCGQVYTDFCRLQQSIREIQDETQVRFS